MADQIYAPNQSMDYNQGLSIAAEQEENQQKPGNNGFHNTYSDFNSEGFSTEIQQTVFIKQHEEQNPLPENLYSQYFKNTQNHSENPEEQDPQKTMQENRNSMDTMLSNGDFMGTQEENGAENGEEKKNSDDGQGRGRRRKSRWGPEEGENNEGTGRKRKTRWADEPKPTNLGGLAFALPDFVKGLNGGLDNDPEVQALNARLTKITTLLTSGLPLDEKPEGARSPSPEPIYDNNGIRINTREYRARERLTREKQEIIQQLIQKSPTFKPPADYRPPKLYKKLYIPVKEFPGYNFIGLIIGPRGNTQKRMEKETGAKIVIRGKGSVKEGKLQQQKRDFKPDPAENEDLHVLVEAETHDALEKAAGMLEKLLHPVDEVLNEHKRAQLKELAALNGTIRDEEFCRLCGEQGHRQYACPSKNSTFKSNVLCEICGDGGHPTIDCPVKNTGKKMDDEYQNFLQEVKAGGVPISTTEAKQQNHQTLAITGSGKEGLGYSNGSSGGFGMKFAKENDESNLYIGYLPPHIDDDGLISLFSPFGEIVACKVIKDRVTGQSKGYGFVKYSDTATAAQAILHMNGYRLDTRVIAVRVAGRPPQAGFPGQVPVPGTYPDPSGAHNSQQQFVPTPSSSTPIRAPVPWGPPVPPSSYNPYAPPVPYPQGGAYPNMMNPNPYASYQAAPPPPGVQPSVDQSQVLPPGVQPENANSDGAPPGTTNAENSATVSMPVSAPPVMPYYQPPPYQPPYVPPPPPPTAPAPTGPPPPWVTNTPPPPPPPASTSDTAAYSDEYEKFMSEMGANI